MSNEAPNQERRLTPEEKQRLRAFFEILMEIAQREQLKQCQLKGGSDATS